MLMIGLKRGFWAAVIRRFFSHQGTDSVAILAYTTLVGIVPMLAVMLSLFSMSEWFKPFESLVMQMVVAHLIPDSQPVIESYLTLFADQASRLAAPGLVVMLFTTLMLLWTVDKKVNSMWGDQTHRRWWVNLFNYLGLSLLGPLLLGLSLLASSYILALPLIMGEISLSKGVNLLISGLPLLFSLLGFLLLYRFVPVARVSWLSALLVSVMATMQLALLKMGFGWYIVAFPTYDMVYGALAAVPVFLLWLYLLWWIVVWNAAVLAEWHSQESSRKTLAG
jgi:membrane protein